MTSVAQIIDKWPTVSAWARDIGLKRESHGTLMKMRGRIPVIYWPAMIAAADRRAITGVTNDTLAAAHAVPRVGRSSSADARETAA